MTTTKLAKDVARELDRRRLRRKLFILAAIVGVLVLAFLYLRCGRGWGLGGGGKGVGGKGAAVMATPDAGVRRCAVRVDVDGITVDGQAATRDAAVAACAKTAGADVVVTGPAPEGTWTELRAALDAAKVPVYLRSK